MYEARQNTERRTGAHNPHVVVADVDLAARVVVLEELSGGNDGDRVLLVVDARDGHALGVNVIRERLVANLRRHKYFNLGISA